MAGQQSGAGSPQQFCLRWNNYQTNLTNVFDQLLQSESFVDVTLACDGHSVKAHKMVLSACSPYFQALFFDNPCQHPIVIMKDIKWPELKAVVEFMYKGEINVSQEQIGPLLKVAESLKIRGLADVSTEHELVSRSNLEESLISSGALQQQARKKRRLGSGDRSPSGASPSCNASDEQDSVSTHDSLRLGSSSTPRSLGSPNVPSISVTPQINLQELPVSGLSLPPPPPPSQTPTSQSSDGGRSGGVGGASSQHVHVSPAGHVTSGPQHGAGTAPVGVNHLTAHAVAQQLSVQQQQAAAAAAAVAVQQHQQQQAHAAQQHAQQQQGHHGSGNVQQSNLTEDMEIKPGIAEMIREEERVSFRLNIPSFFLPASS